jgi:hypothetical protein
MKGVVDNGAVSLTGSQGQYNHHADQGSTGLPVDPNISQPRIVVESDHMEKALEALNETIIRLEERLAAAMAPPLPESPTKGIDPLDEPMSTIASIVKRWSNKTHNLSARIDDMIHRLEL